MRRHRVFFLCTVGLCVISFLHYYKALHYVSVLREFSAPYPNIKSFIMVSGLFWKDRPFPLASTQPSEAHLLRVKSFSMEAQRSMEIEVSVRLVTLC